MTKHKNAFQDGLNAGYEIGMAYEALATPLKKKFQYCLSKKARNAYEEGMAFGYNVGKRTLAQTLLHEKRMQELDQERAEKNHNKGIHLQNPKNKNHHDFDR